jgi:hypothetical protein
MPQFDFYSFSTQVFYVLLGFLFFHFFILNFIALSYSQVLKLRHKLFNTYLTKSFNKNINTKSVYDSVISIVFLNFK